MTAAERSYIGIAKQVAKGTPNVTDAQFKYLLFRAGGLAPQNVVIPLDPEVGGGAMLRDMVKVGVTSGGALDIIPRPETLGWFLLGALGEVSAAGEAGASLQLNADAILPFTWLQIGAQANYALPSWPFTDVPDPVNGSLLQIHAQAGDPLPVTGNITIHGTTDEGPLFETIALNDDAYVEGALHFLTVTKVDLPVYVQSGDTVCIGWADTAYRHTFVLPADQFDAPYFTLRSAPGFLWGESFQDCRVAGLAISFAAARFAEGAVTFQGGLPTPVSTATWSALAKVDSGPQFLAPVSSLALPSATPIKVLSGSVAFGLAIPLDEQWIVGSYSPDDFAINQRSMILTYNVKIADETLYKKMVYDGVGAAAAWTANMYAEADLTLNLQSPIEASTGNPYELDIQASPADDNVLWTAAPIGLRAGRQVVMAVTGVVKNINTGDPITVELVNQKASYA